jgi:restriction system protein
MGVPSFQQLMLPTLQTVGRRYDEISISGLEDEVGKALKITPEDRQLRLPSGNQTLFANRLNWARSYLSKAGLIELPRRGYCRATDRGRELLAEGKSEIDLGTLERYPEFVAWRSQGKGGEATEENGSRDDTEETMASSFELLNAELARDIVGRVHSFTPAFFERLIIDLLVRMVTAADASRWAARLAGLATAAWTASSRRTSSALTSSMSRPNGSIPTRPSRYAKCVILLAG